MVRPSSTAPRVGNNFSEIFNQPKPTTMKTHTLNEFTPNVRERSRAALANRVAPNIADLPDAFVLGAVHELAFALGAADGIETLAEVYAYRIFRAHRAPADGPLTRLVLRFARDVYVVAQRDGDGGIYASTAEKAEAIFAELAAVLEESAAVT